MVHKGDAHRFTLTAAKEMTPIDAKSKAKVDDDDSTNEIYETEVRVDTWRSVRVWRRRRRGSLRRVCCT